MYETAYFLGGLALILLLLAFGIVNLIIGIYNLFMGLAKGIQSKMLYGAIAAGLGLASLAIFIALFLAFYISL